MKHTLHTHIPTLNFIYFLYSLPLLLILKADDMMCSEGIKPFVSVHSSARMYTFGAVLFSHRRTVHIISPVLPGCSSQPASCRDTILDPWLDAPLAPLKNNNSVSSLWKQWGNHIDYDILMHGDITEKNEENAKCIRFICSNDAAVINLTGWLYQFSERSDSF